MWVCLLKWNPGNIWRGVKISMYVCRLFSHSKLHSTHMDTCMHTHLICQVVINMQSMVDNRPKQLMLSVCVPEKQRLASHLNVCGFITEGDRGRERESHRAIEKTRQKERKKRARTTECDKRQRARETAWSCTSHIWLHKRPLSSLTFWLVLDQLFHLALFQCVHHVCQAALAPLGGPQGARGRAPVAAGSSPASTLLFARWGRIVLGVRTQGAPLNDVLVLEGRGK